MTGNFQTPGVRRSGWTAARIAPAPVSPDLAESPLTAAQLQTTPSTLRDPSLGSRVFANPNTGIRTAPIQASVYAQPNVPAFLNQAISDLNSEQALRRAIQAEFTRRLEEKTAGPNGYLYAEALRAAAVNPGASVNFGAAIQDPLVGKAQAQLANAQAGESLSRSQAINAPQALLAARAKIEEQKRYLPKYLPHFYEGSDQQKLDRQSTTLLSGLGPLTSVASAAAGNASPAGLQFSTNPGRVSGWSPLSPMRVY